MNESDSNGFKTLMTGTGEIYGKKISAELVSMYWDLLKKFEYEDISRSFQRHMQNTESGQFFPKPADLIRLIEGDSDSKALIAWTKVEQAIRRIGAYDTVVFDEPEIMCVIQDLGGWITLCKTTEEELPFKRNEFCKRYIGYRLCKPSQHPKFLVGITEASNGAEYKAFNSKPVLIGDKAKAMKVLSTGNITRVEMNSINEITKNLKIENI